MASSKRETFSSVIRIAQQPHVASANWSMFLWVLLLAVASFGTTTVAPQAGHLHIFKTDMSMNPYSSLKYATTPLAMPRAIVV